MWSVKGLTLEISGQARQPIGKKKETVEVKTEDKYEEGNDCDGEDSELIDLSPPNIVYWIFVFERELDFRSTTVDMGLMACVSEANCARTSLGLLAKLPAIPW